MKIGIDCRIIGLKNAGIGRYVDRLVDGLLSQDSANEYVLITRADEPFSHAAACRPNNKSSCRLVQVNVPHYSLKEQIVLPAIIKALKVDFMHYPNFNTPILCNTPYVITIHDLIKHHSRGRETTTRQGLLYWFKYAGYHTGFYLSVKKAKKIIVPTKAIKIELEKFYSLQPDKIVVTYEGVDDKFKTDQELSGSIINETFQKYHIVPPYLLYVGSVYPHKNVDRLIDVVKLINQKLEKPIQLVVVCGRSVFWERLARKVVEKQAEGLINLVGFVPDEDLKLLYNQAQAFVFPTLAEGFGLPGLEAMAAGTPVICSNIPVLKEVYQDAAEYFNPESIEDMVEKVISVISDNNLRIRLISAGNKLYPRYQWSLMVDETLKVYEEISAGLRSGK